MPYQCIGEGDVGGMSDSEENEDVITIKHELGGAVGHIECDINQ